MRASSRTLEDRRPPAANVSVDEYRRDGFVVLRDVFSAGEVAEMRDECSRLIARHDLFEKEIPEAQARRDLTGAVVCDRLDPVTPNSPLFKRVSRDPRLLGPVAAVLGGDPALFKDKLILKPPGTTGYGLHQDYAYWEWTGIPADGVLSLQIALDDADASNGAVILYPGRYEKRLPAPPGEPRDVDESAVDPARCHVAAMQAGDVLIFHSLVPHRSDPNRSGRPRRTLYLIYNDARHGDWYDRYYQQRERA
jgi:2-aminoethylphosphonate dioxygenase